MRDLLICISGPSGVGKGTLVKALTREDENLVLSVSCTTRPPRKGETNGVEYFFLSREEFERGIEEGDFIEYDEHFGNYYGTLRSYVEGQLALHRSVILEIDVVGSLAVKKKMDNVITVFIAPPSAEALESRLTGRGSESEEQLAMRRARTEYEYAKSKEYDYIVVNDDLGRALGELRALIQKEKTI